jgi:glycosyltransferase involved in cell wall biosynthesis
MRQYSIAMVAACPFPANHGTPAAIREMSEELARRGRIVRVVTYPLSHPIPVSGITIDRIRQIGANRAVRVGPNFQRLVFDVLLVFKLFEVVRAHRIDIIHAHNYEAAIVAGIVGKLTGCPVVYNAINTMIGELPSFGFIRPRILANGLARLLDKLVPRMADAIIADTEALRTFLLTQGIAPEGVTTINSGVRCDDFSAGDGARIRERLGLKDERLIVYTGTFDEFQGLDYLLKAFRLVHDQEPSARLLLVGSTVNSCDEAKYARLAEQLGVSSSTIILTSEFKELPDYLAAAEVTVLPRPESGGIPTKLLNYMAAGKPIVSFAGSATILQDGVTGRLVTRVSPEALAEAILQLLRDRDLVITLGQNARQLAATRFSWPVIAEQIEAIYEHLITAPSPTDSTFQDPTLEITHLIGD